MGAGEARVFVVRRGLAPRRLSQRDPRGRGVDSRQAAKPGHPLAPVTSTSDRGLKMTVEKISVSICMTRRKAGNTPCRRSLGTLVSWRVSRIGLHIYHTCQKLGTCTSSRMIGTRELAVLPLHHRSSREVSFQPPSWYSHNNCKACGVVMNPGF